MTQISCRGGPGWQQENLPAARNRTQRRGGPVRAGEGMGMSAPMRATSFSKATAGSSAGAFATPCIASVPLLPLS